jgi:hypothetical protein
LAGIELPEDVRHLIDSSIPTPDALEVLMLIVRTPSQRWTAAQLVEAMRPTVMSLPQVAGYLAGFQAGGLTVENPGAAVSFLPQSADIETAVLGLVKAYNERPVTLIRTVYAIADRRKIQALADAFRLKKDG